MFSWPLLLQNWGEQAAEVLFELPFNWPENTILPTMKRFSYGFIDLIVLALQD